VVKDLLVQKAKEIGFDLVGITTAESVEKVDFPADRDLKRPSTILAGVKSIIVLGFVLWDEAMNLSVQTRSGDYLQYNLYREVTEMLAWRLAHWMNEVLGIKAIPCNEIHLKVAAQQAGLGFIGHSTLVINPQYGPHIRWVTLMTKAELPPDAPFERNLCAEQPLCTKVSLCVQACPCGAIKPGPSMGVAPGEKVIIERCCIEHAMDVKPEPKWDKHINRVSELGYIECTRCANACPYGRFVDETIIPKRRGW
jgi:epoxyqueuosine reductase